MVETCVIRYCDLVSYTELRDWERQITGGEGHKRVLGEKLDCVIMYSGYC